MRVYGIYCTRQTNASTLTSSPVFQIPADLTWEGAARRHLVDDQAVVDGQVSKVGAGASGSPLHETFGYPLVPGGGTETYIPSWSTEWDKVSV